VGSNSNVRPNRNRNPAVKVESLMSCTMADALAQACRHKAQHMIGFVMADRIAPEFIQQHAIGRQKAGSACFIARSPAA
jgi:peptide deformylase